VITCVRTRAPYCSAARPPGPAHVPDALIEYTGGLARGPRAASSAAAESPRLPTPTRRRRPHARRGGRLSHLQRARVQGQDRPRSLPGVAARQRPRRRVRHRQRRLQVRGAPQRHDRWRAGPQGK
jgi:hypothetical protein